MRRYLTRNERIQFMSSINITLDDSSVLDGGSTMALETGKASVIPVRFKNLDQLYKSYMPFLRNGGLFVPTRRRYLMGQEIMIVVQLPGEDQSLSVAGIVSWVNTENATGHKKQGVGVEFSDGNGISLRAKIDALLNDRTDREMPT